MKENQRPESIEPLSMVDAKWKSQATSSEKKRKGAETSKKKRKLMAVASLAVKKAKVCFELFSFACSFGGK